jgi:hypothetical protein
VGRPREDKVLNQRPFGRIIVTYSEGSALRNWHRLAERKKKKNISGGEDRIKIIDRKNVRRLRHTWSPSVDISRLVVFFFVWFFPISFLFFVTHKVPPPPATKLIKSSWVAGNAFSLRNENSFESKESLSLRLLFQRFAYYVFILLARYFNK